MPIKHHTSPRTLSFTAPTAEDAQKVLNGYIQYISRIVEQETMQNIRDQLILRTKTVQQQLELDRVRLTNIHNTNLQRLNYSLEVANAAGIKKAGLQQWTGGERRSGLFRRPRCGRDCAEIAD